MNIWLVLDGLALLLAGAYLLSIPLALAPLPPGDALAREREAWVRLWFPLFGSAAVIASGAASAWWDAWRQTADHCGSTLMHEPFLCWLHPVVSDSLPWGDFTIGLVLVLTFVTAVRSFLLGLRGRRSLGHLRVLSDEARSEQARNVLAETGVPWNGPLLVVPAADAICFVFGAKNPTLVLSSHVVTQLPQEALAAMVAHERAHVERRETFWRPLAQIAILLHAPGFGTRAFGRWTTASEFACDELAGRQVGSRFQVAEALIAFQRLRVTPPQANPIAVGFAEAALTGRVTHLVTPPSAEGSLWWRAWPVAFLGVALLAAPALHRGLEELLHLIHL